MPEGDGLLSALFIAAIVLSIAVTGVFIWAIIVLVNHFT